VIIGLMFGKPTSQPSVAPASPTSATDASPSVTEAAMLTVHVSGEVAFAGLVRVFGDARVADAVAAAGGVTVDADLERINLAAPVSDGQQIIVPTVGGDSAAPISGPIEGLVRLNGADATALEGLPGVGPVLAAKIVAHREQFGPFETVEDLLGVPGIGEQKLAALRDLVMVP
jgi:competence protein ComEA